MDLYQIMQHSRMGANDLLGSEWEMAFFSRKRPTSRFIISSELNVIQSALATCITMCSSGAGLICCASPVFSVCPCADERVCLRGVKIACLHTSATELDESYYFHDFLNAPDIWAVGTALGLRSLVHNTPKCSSETALAQDVINRGEKIVPGCARCQIFE